MLQANAWVWLSSVWVAAAPQAPQVVQCPPAANGVHMTVRVWHFDQPEHVDAVAFNRDDLSNPVRVPAVPGTHVTATCDALGVKLVEPSGAWLAFPAPSYQLDLGPLSQAVEALKAADKPGVDAARVLVESAELYATQPGWESAAAIQKNRALEVLATAVVQSGKPAPRVAGLPEALDLRTVPFMVQNLHRVGKMFVPPQEGAFVRAGRLCIAQDDAHALVRCYDGARGRWGAREAYDGGVGQLPTTLTVGPRRLELGEYNVSEPASGRTWPVEVALGSLDDCPEQADRRRDVVTVTCIVKALVPFSSGKQVAVFREVRHYESSAGTLHSYESTDSSVEIWVGDVIANGD